jgi:CRISPR-associated protein Cmr4
MKSTLIGMLAETFIHPGSGQNVGAIDLPVAREAATGYPFIAGSSLKGALRDAYEQRDRSGADDVFGKQDDAGKILVADARLLLLPVRSLSSAYKWLTCPHLLERLQRDMARGQQAAAFTIPQIQDKKVLTQGQGKLFLEERSFDIVGGIDPTIIGAIKPLFGQNPAAERLDKQLAVMSDNDFSYFARYGLAVQARNVLSDKKTSENLWYEETLVPDTLMYSVLAERKDSGALSKVNGHVPSYLQVGGNETVGQGWFALAWQEG